MFTPGLLYSHYLIRRNHKLVIEEVSDGTLMASLKDINEGKHECLFEMNIFPFDKSMSDLKNLYTTGYIVLNKYSAIQQFKAGMSSLSHSS